MTSPGVPSPEAPKPPPPPPAQAPANPNTAPITRPGDARERPATNDGRGFFTRPPEGIADYVVLRMPPSGVNQAPADKPNTTKPDGTQNPSPRPDGTQNPQRSAERPAHITDGSVKPGENASARTAPDIDDRLRRLREQDRKTFISPPQRVVRAAGNSAVGLNAGRKVPRGLELQIAIASGAIRMPNGLIIGIVGGERSNIADKPNTPKAIADTPPPAAAAERPADKPPEQPAKPEAPVSGDKEKTAPSPEETPPNTETTKPATPAPPAAKADSEPEPPKEPPKAATPPPKPVPETKPTPTSPPEHQPQAAKPADLPQGVVQKDVADRHVEPDANQSLPPSPAKNPSQAGPVQSPEGPSRPIPRPEDVPAYPMPTHVPIPAPVHENQHATLATGPAPGASAVAGPGGPAAVESGEADIAGVDGGNVYTPTGDGYEAPAGSSLESSIGSVATAGGTETSTNSMAGGETESNEEQGEIAYGGGGDGPAVITAPTQTPGQPMEAARLFMPPEATPTKKDTESGASSFNLTSTPSSGAADTSPESLKVTSARHVVSTDTYRRRGLGDRNPLIGDRVSGAIGFAGGAVKGFAGVLKMKKPKEVANGVYGVQVIGVNGKPQTITVEAKYPLTANLKLRFHPKRMSLALIAAFRELVQ